MTWEDMIKEKIRLDDKTLVGLLMVVFAHLEKNDIEGAKESVISLVKDVKGWREE